MMRDCDRFNHYAVKIRLSYQKETFMKTKLTLMIRATLLVILSTPISQISMLFAQDTAFTYQGRLNDGGNPGALAVGCAGGCGGAIGGEPVVPCTSFPRSPSRMVYGG